MSLNFEHISNLIGELASLRYFPTEPAAHLAIARLFERMAETEDQIETIVHELTDGTITEWPGLQGLRKQFIKRFRPRDGIVICQCSCGCGGEHADYSFTLKDSQLWPPRIEPPEPLALLPPGHIATVDDELDAAMQHLAEAKDLNRVQGRRGPQQYEIKPPDPNRPTREEIARALEEYESAPDPTWEEAKRKLRAELEADE